MEKYQLLFESVFKKDPASAETIGFLEKITEAYPYFSTAQFYLLQSLKKDNPEYKKQVKKTAAIFNNNYWLNFQLLEAGMPHTSIVDQQKFSLEEKENVSAADNAIAAVEQTYAAENTIEEPPIIESIEANPPMEEGPTATGIAHLPEDNIPAADQPEPVELVTQNEPSGEHPATDSIEVTTAVEVLPATGIPDLTEGNTPVAELPEPVELTTHEEKTEDPVTEITAPLQPEVRVPEITNELKKEEIETTNQTVSPANKQEKEIPPIKLSIAPVTANIAEDAPLFEPLHTSDYFASVGIKLSEEAKPADKLGRQLKSFTEWLKTMKKIHAEQLMKSSTPAEAEADNTESNIQQLAEKSNVEDEVVTEAMADVLLQQGRKNKAIEVLEKLSLLDPNKSAYFAAKINQIKEP
jgi:hypothetical protein